MIGCLTEATTCVVAKPLVLTKVFQHSSHSKEYKITGGEKSNERRSSNFLESAAPFQKTFSFLFFQIAYQ